MKRPRTKQDGFLTRGEMALRSGVGLETVRFYEQKGLLPAPRRSPVGYRQYTAEDLKRLLFIQKAKTLGFSLAEIGDLLSLRLDPGRSCRDVREFARKKIGEIGGRIAGLRKMRAVLEKLEKACRTRSSSLGECPILEALEQKEEA